MLLYSTYTYTYPVIFCSRQLKKSSPSLVQLSNGTLVAIVVGLAISNKLFGNS